MAASGFGLCMVGTFSAVATPSVPRESSLKFGFLFGFTIFLFIAGVWLATRDY
jgi:hypothetical protein